MTSELKCLYEKLGKGLFVVENTCPPDDGDLQEAVLDPKILDITFDKCDPCKVTFDVYVELPCVEVPDADPEDDDDDANTNLPRVLPQELRIRTDGHMGDHHELLTFVIYPLPTTVNSRSFRTECYCYDICRVPCPEISGDEGGTIRDEGVVEVPSRFRVIFPLSKEIACLIPEFGLSGFYLRHLVSTSLKTQVALHPVNGGASTAVGLLSYDPDTCEACVEYDSLNTDLGEGYECLIGGSYSPPSIEEMAMARRFLVKGLSKCTEKVLLDMDVCFKTPLNVGGENSVPAGFTNYRIDAEVCGDLCSEFYHDVAPVQTAP